MDLTTFDPNPSKPSIAVPAGAVDAHCHVFGPPDVFPYSPARKYTPKDAPKDELFKLRDFLGFERNVIVQPSCYGTDNAAIVDAIAASGGRARGIAVVDFDVSDEELARLDAAGIRGVRYIFVKRVADPAPFADYRRIAERIAPFGWHIVTFFESRDLEELAPLFESLPGIVVVDHLGCPDVALGTGHPQWRRFLRLLDEHPNIWVKVSAPERSSLAGPPYDDIVPFATPVVERYPDRVLWGTDWPHSNMPSYMPDDGKQVDYIARIATTPEARRKLLVDNPMRLYWPVKTTA
jgi:2-pyrone-4,6-dicarboxylate lactonase